MLLKLKIVHETMVKSCHKSCFDFNQRSQATAKPAQALRDTTPHRHLANLSALGGHLHPPISN
jgi:hypothetical protein